MAKPIPDINLRNTSKETKLKEEYYFDDALIKVPRSGRKDLTFVRQNKVTQPQPPVEEEKPASEPAPVPPAPKPPESLKPEDPPPFLEKPSFTPPKPISHSPKISPSSIPNPNPSVTTTNHKQVEQGYPNYGGYMYSVPGYSAFQPVSYPGLVQAPPTMPPQNETTNNEYLQYPMPSGKDVAGNNEKKDASATETLGPVSLPKTQTDFEEHFTPEVISTSASPVSDATKIQATELKMTVTSLAQGSGAIVTIPSQVATNKDLKKKPMERFSLKTSIPISKIDMKCVSNASESLFQNNQTKKPFNPAFHTPVVKENGAKIEIQSNIVIKNAPTESEGKDITAMPANSTNISTLINAAEAISKTETLFKKPEPKSELLTENKEQFTTSIINTPSRPIFNPINLEASKPNFSPKPPDPSFNETKNILFIQNKSPANSKMLLTIQPQNPQLLIQRTGYDQKNLQAPSRPSSQTKKCKEEVVENGTSSKVVSLKRMHQDNYDENDFENLITENQIYGNKIVVKEKSQGTLQEQDLKNKCKVDKSSSLESKNVVLQPNFVYLSNVQFPANLMMIKNNSKAINADSHKVRMPCNENKQNDVITSSSKIDIATKSQSISVSKEVNVLTSNNNVIQTMSNKNNKTDVVFQMPNQKVITNSQIVYQVPMLIDADNKLSQTIVKNECPISVGIDKKDVQKPSEKSKTNDKIFIACPYQMDSKLQPKIVITNLRPKITKIEEVSSLDIYEQRKRLRRLKYLSNRDSKNNVNDNLKTESKKSQDNSKNIITPEKMKTEIYKEFANTKLLLPEVSNESDSDYGDDDLEKYNSIIEDYGKYKTVEENESRKVEFLANFKLATQDECKERELDRQERAIRRDAVASAYIAVGRIDCLITEKEHSKLIKDIPVLKETNIDIIEEDILELQKKRKFLTSLDLMKVSTKYKEGYEKVWQEIIKERKRRDNPIKPVHILKLPKLELKTVDLDPKDQLQILTEIKKQVNENNNLIKKRMDSSWDDGESIKVLAEKNFSELNRLSKMADRSVKHFSGQNTKKRDLNPGFDSENIQKTLISDKYFPNINIPNISKIISLKTTQSPCNASSSQATSMDEPLNSAAGVSEMFSSIGKVQDFSSQVELTSSWPGVENVLKYYKDYETARKREIADLHKRNTALRVESAHTTRAASRSADGARALLAERRHLAAEERAAAADLQWMYAVVHAVRNYDKNS